MIDFYIKSLVGTGKFTQEQAEAMAKRFLFLSDRSDLADRFHMIEPPKSRLTDLLGGSNGPYLGQGEDAAVDEELLDVTPYGGTLVLFDSVTLPHEVLATKAKDRWAASGWFHEDQQQEPSPTTRSSV